MYDKDGDEQSRDYDQPEDDEPYGFFGRTIFWLDVGCLTKFGEAIPFLQKLP